MTGYLTHGWRNEKKPSSLPKNFPTICTLKATSWVLTVIIWGAYSCHSQNY